MSMLSKRHLTAELQSGGTVSIPAWILDTGKPGPALLLVAAQHGNEVHGSEAMRRFVDLAAGQMTCGKVFAVPFANPPALHTRRPHIHLQPEQPYADDGGHNMNRWWPGRQDGNDTARLPQAIYQTFGDEATHALDLHCWNRHNAAAVLIRDVPDIRELARQLGHRFVRVSKPSGPIESTGGYTLSGCFCESGRLGVTYEFAGQYTIIEDEVRRGLRVIVNMARSIGLLPGRPTEGDNPVLFSDECESIHVASPCSGVFVDAGIRMYDEVEQGALVGHVLSDTDLETREVRASVTGYVRGLGASRPHCDVSITGHHPYVLEGETVATLDRRKA